MVLVHAADIFSIKGAIYTWDGDAFLIFYKSDFPLHSGLSFGCKALNLSHTFNGSVTILFLVMVNLITYVWSFVTVTIPKLL